MTEGENKTLTLPPDVVYGKYRESRVQSLTIEQFKNSTKTIPIVWKTI
ncbi:peptidylprolyl isomerase [Methanohalobium evestigatum]|nr:hypothetical protein [Methanohalobium evestigatum]